MGLSNYDNSLQSITSFSHQAHPAQDHYAKLAKQQYPSSTTDSSKSKNYNLNLTNKHSSSEQSTRDNQKLKYLIHNLRNNGGSQNPRYLNTIESEGNLPT